jgi:uncharacterized protein
MNPQLTLDDIKQMTLQDGEDWAVAHALRLLELIRQIGQDLPYDAHALELAIYLHDWGAFPCYTQKGIDHALRSRQVAEAEILPHMDLEDRVKQVILEAIELHDYRDMRPTSSNEALLLREADMLEFLGVIGIGRDFARGPKNLEACYRRVLARQDAIQGRFSLPTAQEIAQQRLERMDQCLRWLEEESFGIL